jgi:hypothetical protein
MTIVRPRRQKSPTRMNTQALEQYASKGISVVINSFQRWDPEIERINTIIEREFRALVHTNVYASFGRDSAFKPHWDEHNVLILQLHGRKRWRFWGQPWHAPRGRARFPLPHDLGPPQWETMLEPGDVLYLPRGEVHAAQVPEGEDSLHLTIGITPPGIESLTAALASACEEDALGREDLPILASAKDRDDWLAAVKTLLHGAVDRLDMDRLLDSLDLAREPLAAGFLGLGRRLSPELLVVSTLRRRLPLPPVAAGATTTLSAGGRNWTIDAMERNILEHVQRHHSRSIANLREALAEFDDETLSQSVLALSGKGLVRLLQDDEPRY